MSTRDYKVEGNGKTTKRAQTEFSKADSKLVKTLADAEVSVEIGDPQTNYAGHFVGKSRVTDELVCTEFKVQSNEGWDHLESEAEKRANGGKMDSYDTTFSMKRTYQLSKEQFDAATGKETSSPPAGLADDGSNTGYLPVLSR